MQQPSDVHFVIEELTKKGSEFRIRGWAVSVEDGKRPEIEMSGGKDVAFIPQVRVDVAAEYGLDDPDVGFLFSFHAGSDKDFSVRFHGRDSLLSVPIRREQFSNHYRVRGLQKIGDYSLGQVLKHLRTGKSGEVIRYEEWKNSKKRDALMIKEEIDAFKYKPLISIVMPVYNVEPALLKEAIDSVRKQSYPYWQLCIADDASSDKRLKGILTRYRSDPKIKVVFREKNGHISEATNSALRLADGEYVAFMDDDDLLEPDALYEYVKLINEDPSLEVIYCDEDTLDTAGSFTNPFFKSDYNRRLLFSHNYITHFLMVKRSLLERTGGLRTRTNGAQDHDLLIRLSELTDAFGHIPKVLYHWRAAKDSVADNPENKLYAYENGAWAINDYFRRNEIPASAKVGKFFGTYDIERKDNPEVTLFFVNDYKDSDLSRESFKKLLDTEYDNLKILAVNVEPFETEKDVTFIRDSRPFGPEEMLNAHLEKIDSDLIAVVRPGIVPGEPDWLKRLVDDSVFDFGLLAPLIASPDGKLLSAGMYFDEPADKVYFPGYNNAPDDLGYFFRTGLSQEVEAVPSYVYLIHKDDASKLTGLSGFDDPINGLEIAQKIGAPVMISPKAKTVFEGEIVYDEPFIHDPRVGYYLRPAQSNLERFKAHYVEGRAYTNDVLKRYRRLIDTDYEGPQEARYV